MLSPSVSSAEPYRSPHTQAFCWGQESDTLSAPASSHPGRRAQGDNGKPQFSGAGTVAGDEPRASPLQNASGERPQSPASSCCRDILGRGCAPTHRRQLTDCSWLTACFQSSLINCQHLKIGRDSVQNRDFLTFIEKLDDPATRGHIHSWKLWRS